MRQFSTAILLCSFITGQAQWTWVPRASLATASEPRWGTCEFVIGGKAYVVGGRVGSNDVSEMWAYDPVADAWEQKASIPGPRRLAAAWAINGKGYVTCGLVGGASMLSDLHEYDPLTNTWTQRASLPDAARYSSAAFTVGGNGYIVGGNQGNAAGPYSTDCWAYDPATNAWTARQSLPGQALFAARGFSADGKGHVFGGRLADQTFTNALWQYDPGTDSWTSKTALPGIPRTYSYAWSLEYHGLIMAGDNLLGEQLNDLWRYLPASDSWTSFSSYTGGGTWGGTAFAIDGRIYAGLGRQGTGAVNDLLELREAFVGMDEAIAPPSITLAPNPCAAGGMLRILLDSGPAAQAQQLVLHAATGQEAARVMFSTGRSSFTLPSLPAGMYMATLFGTHGLLGQSVLIVE